MSDKRLADIDDATYKRIKKEVDVMKKVAPAIVKEDKKLLKELSKH